jgi:hypothetical protein
MENTMAQIIFPSIITVHEKTSNIGMVMKNETGYLYALEALQLLT